MTKPRSITDDQSEVVLAPLHKGLALGGVLLLNVAPLWLLFAGGLVDLGSFDEAEARPLEATVTEHRDTGNMHNRQSVMEVRYRYEVEGSGYQGRFQTSNRRLLEELAPGSPVGIEYLASRPDRSRVPGHETSPGFAVLTLLLAAFTLFALGFSGWIVSRYLALRGLLRSGEETVARVTGRYKNTSGTRRTARYEFDVDGAVYQGVVATSDRPRLDQLVPGDSVKVAYRSSNPAKNCYLGPGEAPAG